MGDAPDETPDENEIVYASGTSVRTRRWVWRQSRSALVGDATTQVFIPIDGFDSATGAQVSSALRMLRNSFSEHLGASVTSGLVSAGQRDFEYVGDLRQR
jgi:DNA/RNA-binding domain of Phe-tRNA-synthetase-like protein